MSESTPATPNSLDPNNVNIDRRTFLNRTAAAIAGAGAFRSTAFSYSRIKGANDRIFLGQAARDRFCLSLH